MAVQSQPISVYAGLPIDESTRREASSVGKSNRANGNVRQDDRLALRKRPGFTPLTTARASGNRTAGRKMFNFAGSPCVIDDAGVLDVYAESKSTSYSCGRVSPATYSLRPLPSVSASDALTDIEIVNGCVAVGYASGSLTVADLSTGVSIAAVKLGGITNTAGVTMVTSCGGRYFVAYVFDGIAGTITPLSFDTQNPTAGWTSYTTISSAVYASAASAGDRSVLFYSSGTTLFIVEFNQGGLIAGASSTITGVSPGTQCDVVVSPDKSVMWLAYFATNVTVQARLVATSSTIVSTPQSVVAGVTGYATLVAGDTSASAFLFLSGVNGSNDRVIFTSTLATVAGATTFASSSRTYGVQLMGRGIRQGGRTLIPVYGSPSQVSNANEQNTFTIVDATDQLTISSTYQVLAPVANIEPGIVYLSTLSGGFPTLMSNKLFADGNGLVYAGFSSRSGGGILPSSFAPSPSVNCRMAVLDFTSRARWQSATHGRGQYIAGAVLSVFTGSSVTEAGIIVAPPAGAYTTTAGALNGIYRYVATYEAIDESGNWVVSGVSSPMVTTTLANNTVTLTFPPLAVTSRTNRSTTRLAIYRTLSGGAAPYYRLGVVANNPGVTRLTYVDNQTDLSISSGSKLFAPTLPGTAGESLDRRAPAGLVDVVSYNGMLVGIKDETIVYSGQLVYGESPWFNPVFNIPVSGGGDFTALDALDGTLFLFKADRIFAVSGDPPADNGSSGGLGQPRQLASDVGCIDPDSVVSTSFGIFFRSARGIELLDRSGSVQFIGDQVYRTVDAYPITTAAVLDERNGLVRFSLAPAVASGVVSGAGVDLVYDLTLQAWVSTDTKTGATASEASQSACIVRNRNDWRYAWLGTNGVVYVEKDITDATACLDGTTWVQSTWELPPWNLGLQREQISLDAMTLFERADAAGLTIEEADDYATTYAPLHVWSETETLAQNQLSFRPKIRTVAVQLRARDTAPAVLGTGKGITFVGMTFDIGTTGAPRLASALRK